MPHRINVDSGRPLESKAHYSRALRINDLVLQSGTTAIDLEGNILGASVVEQIDAIFDIAQASMAAAEGKFDDIVRARAFVVGQENLAPAAAALKNILHKQCAAISLIPVSHLARPTQLVEIELEAIDGAAANAALLRDPEIKSVELDAVRIGKRLLLSAATATAGDVQEQTQEILHAIESLLRFAGAARDDLACLRIFLRDRHGADNCLQLIAENLGDIKPVVSVFEVPSFEHSNAQMMIEAEAFFANGAARQHIRHPEFEGFAQAVRVEDNIFLSNVTPLADDKTVLKPNDWSSQRDICTEKLQSALQAVGGSLDDVINRRFFTHADAEQNQAYGDGPAWFASTRPAALGCRIANHLHNGIVLSLEAHAVRGAGENIEWRKLKET